MGSAFVVYVIFVVGEGFEDRREDGVDREGAEVAKGRKGRGIFGFSDFRSFGVSEAAPLKNFASLRLCARPSFP
jgi:hypothetical protein